MLACTSSKQDQSTGGFYGAWSGRRTRHLPDQMIQSVPLQSARGRPVSESESPSSVITGRTYSQRQPRHTIIDASLDAPSYKLKLINYTPIPT